MPRFVLFLLVLLASCGNPRGVPIQINLNTPEEHELADPWIKELNKLAGCDWVFGPGKVWFDNKVELKMSTWLIEKARKVDNDPDIVGYWDGEAIVMMDKEQEPGKAKDIEALIFLHELGHAVGLEHSQFPTSWMYKEVSWTLSPHDAAWQFVSALGAPHSMWSICDQVNKARNEN